MLQYLCAVHSHVSELSWLRMPCCASLKRQSVYAGLGHLPFVYVESQRQVMMIRCHI